MMVGEFRERALANGERELENTVLLLTRHFDQQFEDSDTIAADVISRLRVSGIATPESFREWISGSDAHEILRIALDDFGTGFSSLSYLKRFPFDKVKIDRCFVSDIEVDGSADIVQAVVNIAASRNMTTTAEGVETEQQRELLKKLGCTRMQGYLFSAAKPASEVRRLLGVAPKKARALA